MRGFLFKVALLALFPAFAAPDAPRHARIDFTSQPDGADVVLDGKLAGITPLVVMDADPGEHKVRFELKNHDPYEEFFTAQPGSFSTVHAALKPMKGLLLVTTDPAECDISIDGVSRGHSPRLITTLDASTTHKMTLQKPGYQTRTVEVRFAGRTPLVKNEKLLLDSATLGISSDPAGAAVTVNGIARGKTPLTVSEIPKGRSTVVLELDGYETAKREVALNAGDNETMYVSLSAKPATLWLSSVPAGARFYVNGDAKGKGPVVVNSLAPGSYIVRAELDGYGTVERTLAVERGQRLNEEFRLENILGRLEIKTSPVGVQVLVDGHVEGVTKSDNPKAEYSDIFPVEGLTAGEHVVTFRKDGFAEVVKHPVIEAQKTVQLSSGRMKRIFKPNIEIVTQSGTYRGVLVENRPEMIVIEVQMGIARSFPRADVLSVNFIDN